VPCSKQDEPGIRTVYATVRERLIVRSQESAILYCTSPPLSLWDHRFARLVNQGSDPTVPYQALVIRESAMLF
jgi:hypothetical protein